MTDLCTGITLACSGAATTFPSLAVCRFLMGVLEAPLNPGLVVITSAWWKTAEQPGRIMLWYCAAGVLNIIMILAFYGIAHIDVILPFTLFLLQSYGSNLPLR